MKYKAKTISYIVIKNLVLIIMVFIFLISYSPQIISDTLANIGLLQFLKASFCDHRDVFCHVNNSESLHNLWRDNVGLLEKANELLNIAYHWNPDNQTIHINLAYILFALGNRQELLTLFPSDIEFESGRNPLTTKNRYEYHLIQAQKLVQAKDWSAAIQEFYQAMTMKIEYILPIDDRDLYVALANQQMELYNTDPENQHSLYLAGKYFANAGLWNENILSKVTNSENNGNLSAEEISRAWLYLGQMYSSRENIQDARMAYDKAISLWPEFREPYLDQIILLSHNKIVTEAQQYAIKLAEIGPTYRLGVHASNYNIDQPVTLPNQWKLVGYDLDEQLLDVATAIDLILWWQIPNDIVPADNMVPVGKYWLQKQTVRNLFVNSGFEWGVDDQGLPLGQYHEYYGAPKGSLSVDITTINGVETHVLEAKSSADNQYIALDSQLFVVDPKSYYLMAGKSLAHDRLAKIGRNCFQKRFGPGVPYYIKPGDDKQPIDTWINYSEISTPFLGYQPGECEILVSNINSQTWAQWDNIIWAQIEIPTP